MSSLTLESTTKEKLRVPLISRGDPTGNAVEFSLTDIAVTDPGAWVAGTWETPPAWNTVDGRVTALTPTIGAAGALVIASGSSYRLWVRWSFGTEVVVEVAATISAI